jgi:hypothetical protein
MLKHNKKSRQQGAKAAPAQTDDDFDDMLAEVCAADLADPAATSVSNPTMGTAVHESVPATASSSSSSSNPSPAPMIGNRDEAIMVACERGNMVQLRRWGRQAVHVASAEPLCACAYLGCPLDILRCLVNYLGADVNLAGKEGCSPLFFAVQQGHLNIVLCLLQEFGADVDNGDDNLGRSPLYLAASKGRLSAVRCLLKFRADINKATKVGVTPLMTDSFTKHAEVVT